VLVGVEKGEVVLEVEVGRIDGVLEAATVDTDHSTWPRRLQEWEKILDKTHTGIIAESEEVVDTFDGFWDPFVSTMHSLT
jgi:hypothetical protein